MKLRDYQSPQVNKLIRQLQNANEGALISAVGTGKTIVTAVVGDELIKRGIVKKVIVSAPFNTIVKEFPDLSGKKFLSGVANNAQYLIGKIDKSENIKHLIDVITGNSSEFLSTSHHAMANHRVRTAVNQADDLSDLLLVIDEAHHCFTSDDEDENKDGTLLGEIADKIKQKGGKILYVTATPYRTVGNQTNLIFDPLKCNPVIRTIGEQMRDGYAPSLNTEYIHVRDVKLINAGVAGIFGDLLTTRISDPQLKTLLPRIVKQWKSEKYPKTILLVPAGNAEHTALEVKKYLEEITFPSNIAKIRGRKHPSVLISVGDSNNVTYDITTTDENGKHETKIVNEMGYDKHHNGHIYDIVIGCRKFDEGTDVSSASHIFMVGLPSSVRLFHQRTGRVLRDKKNIEGYAEWFGTDWVDKSKVVFFAPIGKKTKEFDYKVGRQLLHCIFAAESYQEYCESLNASQNIRIAFEDKHKKAKTEATRAELEEWMTLLGKIELNELKDYSSNEFNELVKESLNPDMTVGERIDMIKSSTMSDDERELALNNIINHLPNDIKDKIDWDAIVNSIMKSGKKKKKVAGFDVPPTSAISDVFDDVLREFYSVKITTDTERAVQQVFSSLSGETFKEWAEKCSQFMGEDYAIATCTKVIEFHNTNNRLPSTHSSDGYEAKLARWIGSMRKTNNGKSSGNILYPSVIKLASDAGLSKLFDNDEKEEYALEMCQRVIDYVNKHGNTPPTNAHNNAPMYQLGNWVSRMKSAKKGITTSKLYPSVVALAESAGLPDLFDLVDREGIALDKCNKFIEYYNTYGTVPTDNDTNPEARSLAMWITNYRSGLSGKGSGPKTYKSVTAKLIDANLSHVLEIVDGEVIALNMADRLIECWNTHKQLPSKKIGSMDVKQIGAWLTRMRGAKKNNSNNGVIFYPSVELKLLDAGLPNDLFEPSHLENRSIRKCQALIDYVSQHNSLPSAKSDDPVIKEIGVWLSNMKRARIGVGKGIIYPSVIELLTESNLIHLIDPVDQEQLALNTCQLILDYWLVENELPKQTSDDSSVSGLAKWLTRMRSIKKKNLNGDYSCGVFYNSLDTIAINAGIPDLFISQDRESYELARCNDIIKFIKLEKRLPSLSSSNNSENTLATWIHSMKQKKQGKSGEWFKSIDELMDKAGLSHIFQLVDKESISLDKCIRAINYYHMHGKYPSSIDNDDDISRLGSWLSNMRSAKRGRYNGNAFYKSHDTEAIKHGLPNMFNANWKDDIK